MIFSSDVIKLDLKERSIYVVMDMDLLDSNFICNTIYICERLIMDLQDVSNLIIIYSKVFLKHCLDMKEPLNWLY